MSVKRGMYFFVGFAVVLSACDISFGQIEVDLEAARKKIKWGENVEFVLSLTNNSDEEIRVEGLRVGPHRPDLWLLNDAQRKHLRRSGTTGPRVVFGGDPRVLAPGEKITEKFLLYHDLVSCGNIPLGTHRIAVTSVGSVVREGAYHPLQLNQEDVVELEVIESKFDQKVWADFVHRVAGGDPLSTNERQELLEDFIEEHPNAPMRPIVQYELEKLLIGRFMEDVEQRELIRDAAIMAIQIIENKDASLLLKEIAANELRKALGDEPEFQRLGSRVSDALERIRLVR